MRVIKNRYHIPAMFVQPPKGQHGATYILTGSEDGKIIFYDLQSRNIAFTLPGHKGWFSFQMIPCGMDAHSISEGTDPSISPFPSSLCLDVF